MFEEQVLIKVTQELKDRAKGFTDEFLQVHDIVRIDGRPKIVRIDSERDDGIVVAYVPVKDHSFYFASYFDNKGSLNILSTGTEPHSSVYFRATSRELDAEELKSLTTLQATTRGIKGQKEERGPGFHYYHKIEIETDPEPDDVTDKIKKLLDILEQDGDGVKRLVESAFGSIVVNMTFHVGNKMLFGAPRLDNLTLKRLSILKLSIGFELYAEGKFFVAK